MPLLGRERRDHEALVVQAPEITSKRAPDRVTQTLTVCPAIKHFCHRSAVCHGADGDVSQRDTHFAAFAARIAVAQCGEQGKGAIGPCDEIPRGQNLVDRGRCGHVPIFRPAHQRVSAGSVDCEVHRLPAIVPAHDAHADHIGPPFGQSRMAKEALLGQIGNALPGFARQLDAKLASFATAQIQRDRFLGAVEILPA